MNNPPTEQSGEAQSALLKRHVRQLSEHFDSIQLFASVHLGDGAGTRTLAFGSGNVYARYGQILEWILKHDERSRIEERDENEEP